MGKLMRQAKPDDVFLFVRPRVKRDPWSLLMPYLETNDLVEFSNQMIDRLMAAGAPE